MSVIAIATGPAVLAWIGLALGLVILVAVVSLFNGTLRPLLEIDRYSRHILDAGIAIARGVDGLDELERTRALARELPGAAGGYLSDVEGRS